MKIKMTVFAFMLFSAKIMAQSATIQPELFIVPTPASLFQVCKVSDNGKIFFNSVNMSVCKNTTSYEQFPEHWTANASDIYYLGKVGLGTASPNYNLDVNATSGSQNLIVGGNVGINTSTPTEKLEIKDREIAIRSTADVYSWRIRNLDASDRLEFLDNGQRIMNVNYGGNISIGNNINSHRLYVEGNVGYAGSLSVEGKGTVSNTNATQLVMHTVTSIATSGSFSVANNACVTASFTFPGGTFSASPAVFIGQNLSNPQQGDQLIKSIDTVTATGGFIRFCNQTGGVINLASQTFSVIAIGQ